MFKTLYGKLAAVLLGFGVMMAVTFIVVIRYSHETYHDEISQKLNEGLAAKLVNEKQTLLRGQQFNQAALQDILDRLTLINPEIGLYLLDESGRIVASSDSQGSLVRPAIDIAPVRDVLDGNAKFPLHGDDPTDLSRKRVFSAAPVAFEGNREGFLYVVLRGDERDSGAQQLKKSYALRESLWVVGIGIVLSLVASLVLLNVVTQPLRRLTRVMEQFRQRGFSEKPDDTLVRRVLGGDDIDRLTATFDEMMRQMLQQMKELKTTDQTRREMVANISHDLRTPLASLRGYLETLHLKRAALSEEERQEYFASAVKQSVQLSKLVTKLFELAKLDADAAEFFPEPFLLDDLVQDVVEKFSLAATTQGVALEAVLPEAAQLVHGDIGLIERVLENLIDNAVRSTPPGGKVTVSLRPDGGKTELEVADTGVGIDAEDLPHIFERFYRGEKSRHAVDSAGLGLAIAKRILELHSSAINVWSERGRGAIFRFRLPLVSSPLPEIKQRRDTAQHSASEEQLGSGGSLRATTS